MRTRTMLVILLALALPMALVTADAGAADPSPGERIFHQANEAYSRGDYQRAIALYEEVVASDGLAANVLLNLGNSYAQAGQTGRAILNYERGLRLSPDDADLQGNLQLLRREKGLFAEQEQGWQPWQLLSLDRWALLALTALLLLAIWQLLAPMMPKARKWRLAASLACLAVLILATTGAAIRYRSFHPSVVISSDARLLLSPFPASASVGAIQEGRLVTLEKRHGDFFHVVDENGRRGWILAAQLEAVVK